MYPPLPAPPFEYDGEKTVKAFINKLAAYLSPKITEVAIDNINWFLEEKPGTPKVLLFTDKPTGNPTIYQALVPLDQLRVRRLRNQLGCNQNLRALLTI